MSALTDAPTPALRGSLELVFEGAPSGNTVMRSGYRTGAFHFSKPYDEGGQLVVQVVNPTAGVFEGDELQSRYIARSGARAAVVSPSSTQVYAMPGGRSASLRQRLDVEEGSALSLMPKWIVLHRGARVEQSTLVDLDQGASLFLTELISAGRVSSNEFLEFDRLVSTTEIRVGGRLLLRERMDCGQQSRPWVWRSGGRDFPFLGTVFVVFPDAANVCESLFPKAASGHPSTVRLGWTALERDFVSIRAQGANGLDLLGLIGRLSAALAGHVPVPAAIRRIG